jgi:hypothetical protein
LRIIIFPSEKLGGKASAQTQKNRSPPALRTPTYNDTNTSSITRYSGNSYGLSQSQLLQRLEQSLVVLLNICKQYISTATIYLYSPVSKFELRVLSVNLSSLVSQIESVQSILNIYTSYYPSITDSLQLLPPSDRTVLFNKISSYYVNLWDLLKQPSSSVFQNLTVRIITSLDHFLVTFPLLSSSSSRITKTFVRSSHTAKPSVIKQITQTEVTVDPYLKALQSNYYFPISNNTMASEHLNQTQTPMVVDHESPIPRPPSHASMKKVTIEDSMEVISELISEIQKSENQSIPAPVNADIIPKAKAKNNFPLRISLARRGKLGSAPSSNSSLSLTWKLFHSLLGTGKITILPIHNNSKISPIKSTTQVNELTLVGVKSFLKASKPNSGSIAGDLHILTSMSFDEVCLNTRVSDWMNLHGYYLVLSDCQSSDMVRISFLLRVQPFTWRDDLKSMIRDSPEWCENPFQFRLFYGSVSSNRKGASAPVLMVEVERENLAAGMDFFCNMFDGENPLSPCSIPYLFLTLYQNTLSDSKCSRIIEDINHHIGHVQLIRLYGLKDIDGYITLKKKIQVRLRKILLNLRAPQTTNRLFNQVEKEMDAESILCSFDLGMYDIVMQSLPNISTYICQCICEEDFKKIFVNDYLIFAPAKVIAPKKGFLTTKSIPLEIQEHTSYTLSKMSKAEKRSPSPSPSVSSFSTSTAPSTYQSDGPPFVNHPRQNTASTPSASDKRFLAIETQLNTTTARMDSIEDLCRQLKSNTDIISLNIQQLATNFYSTRQIPSGTRPPAAKAQRLSED